MDRTCKTTEKDIRSHTVLITTDDIRKAFDIPKHVSIMIPTYNSDVVFGERLRYETLLGNIKSEWKEEETVRES
jgi:hypothetical protein